MNSSTVRSIAGSPQDSPPGTAPERPTRHSARDTFNLVELIQRLLEVRVYPGTKGFKHPGFWCLLREMFKFKMSERDKWLNLSDGGHIENMAVYELLRRRCKFIICVDGEADPSFEFPGLMTLVRYAQIDLGVRIEPQLAGLRPDPETTLSRTHYHFCPIHYPAMGSMNAGRGFLLYLKLSVTGNETELIKKYREKNADFPHQTTLDQFFDQEQFEAYRELGVHVAEGVFTPPLWVGAGTGSKVHTWFRNLAANLLPPEV